mgnify:CR=1 FL=1
MMHYSKAGFITDIRQEVFISDKLFSIDAGFSERSNSCQIVDSFLVTTQFGDDLTIILFIATAVAADASLLSS